MPGDTRNEANFEKNSATRWRARGSLSVMQKLRVPGNPVGHAENQLPVPFDQDAECLGIAGRGVVHTAKNGPRSLTQSEIDLAGQQRFLPGPRRLGSAGHGEDILGAVAEEDPRDRFRRQQGIQNLHHFLLAPDAIVLESGAAQTREEYEKHHLAEDIAFSRAVATNSSTPAVHIEGNAAWVSSTSRVTGIFNGREMNSAGAELMVLTNSTAGWRIRSIHWSSHKMTKAD